MEGSDTEHKGSFHQRGKSAEYDLRKRYMSGIFEKAREKVNMTEKGFPEYFLWGAATAAAQIEGGYLDGGRSLSIWDTAPGEKIHNHENCHVACDHYHRWQEDIELMKQIGLKSYRFSISWSRIVPSPGVINEEGLRFYSDLTDGLLNAGIEPLVTLYHWDLPVWMYEKGGWRCKEITDHFLFYAEAVVNSLSDRVTYWMTFNEPQCFLMNGYMQGVHAPFERDYLCLSKIAANMMVTHGRTVRMIREHAKKKPMIGIAFSCGAYLPEDENDPRSVRKAEHASFYRQLGIMNNRFWMDPILKGKAVSAYGIYHIRKKDLKTIHQRLDFVGINVYEAFNYQKWGGDKNIDRSQFRTTYLDWVIDGRAMYYAAKFVYARYHIPLMITENGMAWNDSVDENGEVNDQIRIDFIDEYLKNLKRAMAEGTEVIGYQHWSLMDNFEWAEGYDARLGLIHVDYSTQKRTLKKSAYHYRDIIASNGSEL